MGGKTKQVSDERIWEMQKGCTYDYIKCGAMIEEKQYWNATHTYRVKKEIFLIVLF